MNQSYFVKYPKTYKDLLVPSQYGTLTPYQIIKTIFLSPLDYENFIYGLDADRQYIEDNAFLYEDATVIKCLLIKEATRTDGILVVPEPEKPYLILMAAIFSCDE